MIWGGASPAPEPSTKKGGGGGATPPLPPGGAKWHPVGILSVLDDGSVLHFRVVCAGPPDKSIVEALEEKHGIAIKLMP